MVFFSKTQAKVAPENYGARVKSITVRICVTNCTGNLYVTDILLQAGAVATGWVGHASLIEYDGWKDVAENVWITPKEISDKLTTNNLTLDCLRSLHEKYGDDIHLMFDCSTRDGDLAKVQHSLQNGLSMLSDVDEFQGDEFQETLKRNIPLFKDAGVSLFIFDGVAWYDDPRNLTAHTIISTPVVWLPFEEQRWHRKKAARLLNV